MGKSGHHKNKGSKRHHNKCDKCHQKKCQCVVACTDTADIDLRSYVIDFTQQEPRNVDLDDVRGCPVFFNSGATPIILTSTAQNFRSISAAIGSGVSAVSTTVVGGSISPTDVGTAAIAGLGNIMPRDGIITSIVFAFTVTTPVTLTDNVRFFVELFGARFSEQSSVFTEIQSTITPATTRFGTAAVSSGTVFFGASTPNLRLQALDRFLIVFGFVSDTSSRFGAAAEIRGTLTVSLAIDENFCQDGPPRNNRRYRIDAN